MDFTTHLQSPANDIHVTLYFITGRRYSLTMYILNFDHVRYNLRHKEIGIKKGNKGTLNLGIHSKTKQEINYTKWVFNLQDFLHVIETVL